MCNIFWKCAIHSGAISAVKIIPNVMRSFAFPPIKTKKQIILIIGISVVKIKIVIKCTCARV